MKYQTLNPTCFRNRSTQEHAVDAAALLGSRNLVEWSKFLVYVCKLGKIALRSSCGYDDLLKRPNDTRKLGQTDQQIESISQHLASWTLTSHTLILYISKHSIASFSEIKESRST